MQWYEEEVGELEARFRDHPPPPGSVAFYGSSSIRLWTTLASDFPDVPAVNCAFGGSTMAACSWFFWRIVVPLRPSALVLYAGDNDIGDGVAPDEVVRQLGFLVRQLDQACGPIPLAVISIKPSPARWHLRDRIVAANAGIAAACAARPRSVFVDVHGAMLAGGAPRRELYEDDGLHLSPAGYSLWKGALQQRRAGLF